MLPIGIKHFALFGNFEPNCRIRQIVFANIGNPRGRYFITPEYFSVYQLGTVKAIGVLQRELIKKKKR